MSIREKNAINYRKKLIDKFKYNPDVKRIIRKRNLPKYLLNKQKVKHIQKVSAFRKQKNVMLNSNIENIDVNDEKRKKIVQSSVIEK